MIAARIMLFLAAMSASSGQEFTAPAPYPVDRYEAGWNTNPFTLKTAAVAIQKESFAKDLFLGGMYQFGQEITVILVNSKTRERIRLVSTKTSPNGMRIKSATILNSLRDSYAEIEKGGEVAIIRHDEKLQKQLASQNQAPGTDPNQSAANGSINVTINGSGSGKINVANAPATSRGGAPQLPGGPGNTAGNPNTDVPTPPGRNSPPQRRRLLTAPRSAPAPAPANVNVNVNAGQSPVEPPSPAAAAP